MGKGLNEWSSDALTINMLIRQPFINSGWQSVECMILRSIGKVWVNLTTFDISWMGKGLNQLPYGITYIHVLHRKTYI